MKKTEAISWILIGINCFYAGLTSAIFYGIRVFDILIIAILLLILRFNTGLQRSELAIIILLALVFIYGTFLGISNNNDFVLSGLREFGILIATYFVALKVGSGIKLLQVQKVFYISVFLVTIIYIFLMLFPGLQYFYASVDDLKLMTDQEGRIHGPNPIFITLLFALLCNTKTNFVKNFLLFSAFTIFVYAVTQTRQLLAIMGGVLLLSAVMNGRRDLSILGTGSLIGFLVLVISTADDQGAARLLNMFRPLEDTSFLYRLNSNTVFVREFFALDLGSIIFGLGFGSTMTLYLGSYIGDVSFVLLDNSVLTLMMRVGLFGLSVVVLLFLHQLLKVPFRDQVLAWIPIFFGTMLSAHLFTNPLYILGFVMHISVMKRIRNSEKNYIPYN